MTAEQLTEIAQPIAEAIAKNCKVAPELVFPHLFLGLQSILSEPLQPRETLLACDAVCERIITQDSGILGGVDFHALQKSIRAALASKPPAGEQKPVADVTDFKKSGEPIIAWRDGATVRRGGALYAAPQLEQVAQDKIDAERYRWLRAHNDPNDFGVSFAYPIDSDWGPALDVAIDAARARGEGGAKV